MNQVKGMYEPQLRRKGDCISLEIETAGFKLDQLVYHGRKGDCISLEIETYPMCPLARFLVCRKGDCISLEIETLIRANLVIIGFAVAKGIASRLRLKLQSLLLFP